MRQLAGWFPAIILPAATADQVRVLLLSNSDAGISAGTWVLFLIANIGALFLGTPDSPTARLQMALAFGLTAALERLGLSPHEVVGVGDAENDHAFLNMCEFSAAVSNALPALKDRADLTLTRDHGAGVAELIDHMLTDDLAQFDGRARRHQILLGTRRNGKTSRHCVEW